MRTPTEKEEGGKKKGRPFLLLPTCFFLLF
jgi:hypothetical protein